MSCPTPLFTWKSFELFWSKATITSFPCEIQKKQTESTSAIRKLQGRTLSGLLLNNIKPQVAPTSQMVHQGDRLRKKLKHWFNVGPYALWETVNGRSREVKKSLNNQKRRQNWLTATITLGCLVQKFTQTSRKKTFGYNHIYVDWNEGCQRESPSCNDKRSLSLRAFKMSVVSSWMNRSWLTQE